MASRAVGLSQNPSRSRQLDFSKAMNDFKVMFPTFDYEVIEMILRANNGLVDATVDQLLAMQTENSQTTKNKHLDPELNVRLPSYIDEGAKTSEPPPAYTPRVEEDPNFRYDSTYLKQHFSPCYHSPTTATINAKKPSFSNGESSRYRSPMIGTLPNDFLRLNFDSHENTKPVKRVTCNREAIFTNNPFYDVRTLEMPKNSSREYTSRRSQGMLSFCGRVSKSDSEIVQQIKLPYVCVRYVCLIEKGYLIVGPNENFIKRCSNYQ